MSQQSSNPDQSADPAVWRTVWVVLVGALAVVFDTTIVAVALHTLADQLHTSVATIQWVSTGYLLALGVTVPIAGWAQRVLGAKRLWLLALGIFLMGSILSSLAWSASALIVFRIVQGIGGGIMLPLMATIVMQAAGGAGLGRVMSAVSLPAVLGPILGPVIGGAILAHLHWSWLFWVNVPFCVVGLGLAAALLPADGPVRRVPLDVVGVFLLSPGLVGILWGLSNAGRPGAFGRTDVLWPVVVGVLLLGGFVGWALRRRARALVDVALLRHRPLASSSALLFLSGIALYGAMLLLPLYFQQLRGMTVLGAGAMLIPQGIGTLLSRSIAGRLSDTIGSRPLALAGFAVVAIGTLPFALADQHTGEVWLTVALLLRGLGLGAVTVPLMALAFRGLARNDIPDASVISRIATQVGGAFGTAVLAVVLEGALTHARSSTMVAAAFRESFWWCVVFAVLGVGLSFLLPGRPVSADDGESSSTAISEQSPTS
ncbi:MDR family MFS transporter [Tsukamurella sp. 8F]|uniref:MDR family MFS transporter n=1 Tax=unclassified Tsukamurella TaxID=2633480 RepID=UPI0023B8D97D|nr:MULTISPECIES: MDR family MFS transporter [unclassified Tsukamurella]MDF0528829.1 MDR family MFS transporter [Tsukamurella sp. 8J]MDF0586664.1 MDR family MFS transporter [Tsukamurella sp. 8F]